MEALRGRLRARAEAVVALVETVVDEMEGPREDPLTPADGWKAVRLMRQADAMVCQLYATPDSVIRPPSPAKTGRPAFADDEDDEPQDEAAKMEAARRQSFDQILRWISAVSGNAGFWPNGEPAGRGERLNQDNEDDLRKLDVTAVFASYPDPEPEGIAGTQFKIVEAVNASTQHAARHSGHWPDGSRFDPNVPDPGYYSVTDSWGTGRHRKPYEGDGPTGMPWWVVRKTSPPPD